MKVVQLYTHCLKSSRGVEHQSVVSGPTGFEGDRAVDVIDADNKIITGREYPELLRFSSNIRDGSLEIISPDNVMYYFPLPNFSDDAVEARLFSNKVKGFLFSGETNAIISNILKGSFRLLYIGSATRPLLSKRGGRPGERTAYADSSPVHLINLRSLDHLNTQLKRNISDRHFRPNIVVDGLKPFAEDAWSLIEINGMPFRVRERTQRCMFTSIDPTTQKKDVQLEPLSTIAKLRKVSGLKPTFGIGLVPLSTGEINVGDFIKIIHITEHNNNS